MLYLPPDRGDIPAFTPAKAGTRLSDPGGMQGWVDLVGWLHTEMVYACPKTVTHPSTNRARRELTSFMRRTQLTTTPRRAANQENDEVVAEKERNKPQGSESVSECVRGFV